MNTTTLLSVALIGAFLALFIVVRQLLIERTEHRVEIQRLSNPTSWHGHGFDLAPGDYKPTASGTHVTGPVNRTEGRGPFPINTNAKELAAYLNRALEHDRKTH